MAEYRHWTEWGDDGVTPTSAYASLHHIFLVDIKWFSSSEIQGIFSHIRFLWEIYSQPIIA